MIELIIQNLVFIGFAYGLGSIPFGLIITKIGGGGDIRQIGSGNIGATNVLRTGNKTLAALTLVADAGKGAVAVLVAKQYGDPASAALAAIFVVIGHCFPVWLKFSGGKGVATSLAVLASLDIRLGGLFVATWLGTAFVTRYSSLSALLAMLACVAGGFVWLDTMLAHVAIILLGAIVWMRHHANIGRLFSGTESKIGKK
ncbi:MAG: glycerol-3-phosphate 1-O-acyltransferase PlsY [Candidatus Puniceispirillum sp.]|jgi:glycerol-3-phosphate acyltransferase PlsY